MPDFNSDQEFADYIEALPFEQLVDVSLHLDSDKYPERYKLVHNLLGSRMTDPTQALDEDQLNTIQAEVPLKGLVVSRRVYLTLAILFGIALPLYLIRDALSIERVVSLSLNVGLYSLVYFGLRKRRSWVVSLILFVAYLNLLILFIGFLSAQGFTDVELVINRIGGLILAIFWISQIIIFSKQTTRAYFNETGTTLIGLE